MRAGEDGGRDISDTGRTRRKRPGAARALGTDSVGFDRSLPGPAAGCRLPAGGEPPSAPSPWLSRPRWTPPPSPALNAGPAWAGSLAPLACHFRPSGPLFGVPWTPRFFPNQAVILPASQAGGGLLSPGVGSGSGFQAVPCPRTGCKCWAGGGGGGAHQMTQPHRPLRKASVPCLVSRHGLLTGLPPTILRERNCTGPKEGG